MVNILNKGSTEGEKDQEKFLKKFVTHLMDVQKSRYKAKFFFIFLQLFQVFDWHDSQKSVLKIFSMLFFIHFSNRREAQEKEECASCCYWMVLTEGVGHFAG